MKKGIVGAALAVLFIVLWQARLHRGQPSEEAAAIGALRAISAGQSAYAAAANSGYASTLVALATACPGSRTAFISATLASDPTFHDGYEISLQRKPSSRALSPDCHGAPTYSGYYAAARPIPGTGAKRRAFATDETGTIWFDASGVPPNPPSKGSPLQ